MKEGIRGKPLIALFIDWTENKFHVNLISGVSDRAKELGCNLVVYPGGGINSPRKWEQPRKDIYDLVSPDSISGIIIAAASVGHFSTREQILQFCSRYSSFPVVCTSQRVEGIPSVLIDNAMGYRKLVMHLVVFHGYKNIAFIKGPSGNHDSEERFRIYKEVLQASNIPFNTDLIVSGDFEYDSGIKAAQTLLSRSIPEINAICAANDEMALGAREELVRRGIDVPGDIAITGFDDEDFGKYVKPPFTTVRQPVYKQGRLAVDLLVSLVDGKIVDPVSYIDTEFIMRESCGCKAGVNRVNDAVLSIESRLMTQQSPGASTELSIGHSDVIEWNTLTVSEEKERLAAVFFDSLNSQSQNDFICKFSSFVESAPFNGENMAFFENFIDDLRTQSLLPHLNQCERVRADELIRSAQVTMADILYRRQSFFNSLFEQDTRNFRELIEEIVSFEDFDDVFDLIKKKLGYIGLRSFYFSLYEHDEKKGSDGKIPDSSYLVVAINEAGQIPIEKPGIRFPTRRLVPHGLLPEDRQYTLCIEPFYFGTHQLGLAVFELNLHRGRIQAIVQRLFINSLLKSSIFLKQVQLHSQSLEAQVLARTDALSKANDLLKKLYIERGNAAEEVRKLNDELEKRVVDRTSQLLETNTRLKKTVRRLKNTQAKLIQSEKLAALGGLVAGITHEINTPIGIGVTAASHLEASVRKITEAYRGGTLKKSELEECIESTQDATKMILSNLNRAYDLIKSFKKVAVDQSTEEKRSFGVKEYINEVIQSLQLQIKKSGVRIAIKCPDSLEITSYPGPFSQIITNFIMNSLTHAFDENEKGEIIFDISEKEGCIVFVYSDNGKGIMKEHLSRIYEPFFTTKRGHGGTGLGLHLVYNIVTKTLGGTIDCTSKPGEGTTFTIMFPLR